MELDCSYQPQPKINKEIYIKYMKTNRWFNRNGVFPRLRIAGAVTLMSAAAAMAFVADHGVPIARHDICDKVINRARASFALLGIAR